MFLLLAVILPLVAGKQFLFLEETDRSLPQCRDRMAMSCQKVSVSLETLLESEELELPALVSMKKSRIASQSNGAAITFDNEAELLQGVFVHGETDGQTWVSGSVNWAKAGRHFKLETCAKLDDEKDCFIWKEIDPKIWHKLGESHPVKSNETMEDRELSQEAKRWLEQGRQDTTTPVTVTVTVHTTPEFRALFQNNAASITAFINLAIAESNQGYVNSRVPITLALHCIVDSTISSVDSFSTMINTFNAAANGDYNTLRRSADIALLMTTNGDSCGIAYLNAFGRGYTIGVVAHGCATGYYSTGHEIGHMYGCLHNREVSGQNPYYPNGSGFLMNPPVNSGYRTILAYSDPNYSRRINFYSSANSLVQFNGISTGNAQNDNAALLTQNRVAMSNVGNEAQSCSATAINGNWGAWSAFSTCSKTCGGGTQTHTRVCNNPAPSNGGAACPGSNTETTTCNTQACGTTAAVVLVGGTASGSGNVFARNPTTGIYGPVCDDNWGIADANVVCRQLGFSQGALTAQWFSLYGQVPTSFSYDEVKCTGTETTLDACPHQNTHDCGPSEGAGVVCNPGTPKTLALLGSRTNGVGNVFALNPTTGIYGPVCDDRFAIADANVVCKQLGFPLGATSVSCCSRYGEVSTRFSYDEVGCTGSETTLNACPHQNTHDCGAREGAGVVCRTA